MWIAIAILVISPLAVPQNTAERYIHESEAHWRIATAMLIAGRFVEREHVQTWNRTLSILAAAFIVLAFVLKVAVPQTLFVLVSWGMPFGSHYVRMGWLAFWVFLVAGLVMGVIAVLKIAQ